ncbi:MAG: bifunctional diaminohydroxyphosphoribosylaminopyrimidine deaminase/5-amino-6-(5-phosphoribosylamino)uracil reductase RibD, partial [Chloroflexota bacterium]
VNGAGLRLLRERGVETHVGLLRGEAEAAAEPFLKRVATGLPFIEVKAALTLDGRAATASGRSRWITGDAARAWVHARRNTADAVMVGAGTARQDDPELTVRLPGLDGRQPLRVVVSASGRLDPALKLFGGPPPGALVFVPPGTRAAGEVRCEVAWVDVPRSADGGVDMRQVLAELARRGVNDVLVEGGAGLNATLLRAGLVDRLSIFVAAKLFGGKGLPGIGDLGVEDPAQGLALRDVRVTQVGEDWLFQGRPGCGSEKRG